MVLEVVAAEMKSLGLNYAYEFWSSRPMYPYFTGDYVETGVEVSSGKTEGTMYITGWARKGYAEINDLLAAKDKIKQRFCEFIHTDDEACVYLNYTGFKYIPTGDEDLSKIEITIDCQEWQCRKD